METYSLYFTARETFQQWKALDKHIIHLISTITNF